MAAKGLCECGCGQRTSIARQTNTARGWVKGEPVPYMSGHGGSKRFQPLPDEQRCTWCGEVKAIEDFPTNGRPGPQPRQSRCRACFAKRRRELAATRREVLRERDRANYRRNAEKIKARKRAWAKNNREKLRAHTAVKDAIRHGDLTRPDTCERCGDDGSIQAHHPDYTKPLEVVWLCAPCHGAEHSPLLRPPFLPDTRDLGSVA